MDLQRGDKGPAVAEIQRQLLALGYPVGAPDGICGPRTLAAWEAWQRAKAHDVTPRMGAHPQEHNQGPRTWEGITGLTLHNTAAALSEKPERWNTLKAQVGVTRGGKIYQVYPLDAIVWHGHGLNRSTVGIECAGTYEGIEGRRDTWWRPPGYKGEPQRPTAELIEAARRAVRWAAEEVRAHGGEVRYVYAHRQSRASRLSDPGQVIWREVALWAERELGLETRPGFTVGDGRPVPREWDEGSAAPY